MEGPKVKIVVFNRGEVPTTLSGKVPKIGQFYQYSNAQRVLPFSAMGFGNYVLY